MSQLKEMIKSDEFLVLVVTPAILNNYFEASSEASIGDFTLLIFDECHHAKEAHPYNTLLEHYYKAKGSSGVLPQVSTLFMRLTIC